MDTLTTVEKAALLIEVDLFQEVPSDVLAELAAQMEETAHQSGDVLNEPDSADPRLYVVIEGDLRLTRGSTTLGRLERGGAFGLLAVLGIGQGETATALSACRLLSISPEEYLDALADSTALAIANLRTLGRRLQELDRQLSEPTAARADGADTR
ncbi:MAG TPA: Crp/Fnr family transcriptional regulator [Luteitalea sp.]|nr:Crp/Fnr family transcriptional regulator [Luteitalea sp.]